MVHKMTNDEMRNRINSGTKWIANFIFGMSSNNTVRYAKAYDKLNNRFLIDYGINLNDRIKSSKTKNETVFDVIDDKELEMLLQSLYRLENMYVEVMENKGRVNNSKKRKELCYG